MIISPRHFWKIRACCARRFFGIWRYERHFYVFPVNPSRPMKKFLRSRNDATKGAALIIVLAFVVLVTGLALVHFSRTTTDRQLAQSSYHDTSADLLVRTALDITVSDLKQEIATNQPVTATNIQPARYPTGIPTDNRNLIRYSSQNDARSRASTVISTAASADGRSISRARWNSHYLVPPLSSTGIDPTPVADFTAPDWVLVTAQGPGPTPAPDAVIGRYAFAVYDEGGLIDVNLGGFPTYASLTRPTLPARRLPAKFPSEESEIMLVSANPNPPCQVPKFAPSNYNAPGTTGAAMQPVTVNTNGQNPQTFTASFLPHGVSIDANTGTVSGVPTSPGTFDVILTATNQCGFDTATLHLMITGGIPPDATPWPVNLARKGTWAFADLTALSANPGDITQAQINQLTGWRNYATTQQPPSASFTSPSFPLVSADNYARYFIGSAVSPYLPPYITPYTTVRNDLPGAVVNGRTDQALMTRQELIKLQRTIGFSQSLLQYLGTFSRDTNRPAPDWPHLGNKIPVRWDMNNLAAVIPDSWIWPGHHGVGHAYGLQKRSQIGQWFGLEWVNGTFADGTRETDPNYYGHWHYFGKLKANNNPPLQGSSPDFFQIIDYAMNQAIGVNDPNHMRNTFNIGAALIDQYDTDDLYDMPPGHPDFGNTITIIDYDGIPADYAYGIEGMSYDRPQDNPYRAWFAPYPPDQPAGTALLNRRFENVGEFGYAHNPDPTLVSKTLDFASAASNDRAMLDFFTYNTASRRAGIVNLNTRNVPVLASVILGAWLRDQGSEYLPPDPTYVVSQKSDALAAGQEIVTATTAANGAAVNRADVARLAAVAGGVLGASDEAKETIARALAEVGQARTWNLMIDVIAQTGQYSPGTLPPLDNSNANKFIVQGEKRYWLHIALDRDDGTVLGSQLEEVVE